MSQDERRAAVESLRIRRILPPVKHRKPTNGSRLTQPVQSGRPGIPVLRTASGPPSAAQSRVGTPSSQRMGAQRGSPGIPTVPDKKAKEIATKKRIREEKKMEKARKKVMPLRTLAPKLPGPPAGGKRKCSSLRTFSTLRETKILSSPFSDLSLFSQLPTGCGG